MSKPLKIDGRYSLPAAQRPKPDGRYSTVYATDMTIDEWDEVTAVETPNAIDSEPPGRRKRSGEYRTAELAYAVERSATDSEPWERLR